MKKLSFLALFTFAFINVQAQSFGQSLLNGLAKGLSNAAQMQRQRMQSQNRSSGDVYQQSKDALGNSSFSLANTHATAPTTGTYRFSNGDVFSGRLLNGQPMNGVLEKPDGTKYHCSMNNGLITGWCFTEWTDGSWYYGNWKDGRMDGEGSYFDGIGNYYDMIYSDGTRISSTSVLTPKHSKEEYEQLELQKAQIMLEALNEQNTSTSQYSSSTNSRRNRYTTSQIQRQADVTAKAYEMYKSNPNATSRAYYDSNKRLLDTMQGR